MTKPQPVAPPFEKEVVRMPDGRELTFYRFPEPPPRDRAGHPAKPSTGEER